MHNKIPEISNGTVLSSTPLMFSSISASNSQPVAQGITSVVSGSANTILLNGSTTPNIGTSVKQFISSLSPDEPSSGSNTEGIVVEKRVRTWHGEGQHSGMAILRELKVLTSPSIRRHPNIVKLVAYKWEDSGTDTPRLSPVLSFERAVASLAHIQSQERLQYAQKRALMLDISRGLSVIHAAGVIHGDLKSENVLLFRNGNGYTAKLCDFGFSILLADIRGSQTHLHGGTALYMAPECLSADMVPVSALKKTDYYSLGLLFWRLLLDGHSPFDIAGLTQHYSHEVLKRAQTPSLLGIASFSILLIEDLKTHFKQVLLLLSATIQRNPAQRSLRVVLTMLGDRSVTGVSSSQVTVNPNEVLDDQRFDIRNLPVWLRHQALPHLRAGAKAIEGATHFQAPGFCSISRTLIEYSLGDGGLSSDDDPESALHLIVDCAERGNIGFQAIVVRMFDCFGVLMPDTVQKRANEYIANGVANGSHTAFLDYSIYWPQLQYQTVEEPESFLYNLRTRFSGGIGIEVDSRTTLLQDTSLLQSRLASGMNMMLLKLAYGLNRGNNLMHGAAMLDLCDTGEVLIRKFHVNLNEQNEDGDTPLLLACRHGNFNMTTKLLANGARPDIANKLGETPLHWALNVPDEPFEMDGHHIPSVLQLVIMMLVDEHADINSKAQLFSSGGEHFQRLKWAAGTPLHRAVSRRNLAAARYLLRKGADPLATDGQPEAESVTPLDIAANHHNVPMLKLLLDACPHYDVNAMDQYGTTLFSRAISSISIMQMIVIHGKQYPKAIADTMDVLISHGLNLDIAQATSDMGPPAAFRQQKLRGPRDEYYTFDALYLATYFEKLAWVQYMLASPACAAAVSRNINRPNGFMGRMPLHASIEDGRRGIFRALLAAGADPTLRFNLNGSRLAAKHGLANEMGCLHLAVAQGDPDLFFTKRLLGYDLDLEQADIQGTTPLCAAVLEGRFHIATALLEAGANINKLMGAPKARADRRQTVLERVIAMGANDTRHLQYLLGPEAAKSSDNQPSPRAPWLTRPGPPASMHLGDTTALHFLIDANAASTDSTFAACLRVVLDACRATKPDLIDTLALPRRLRADDEQYNIPQAPLHLAAKHGNAVAVKMLLEAGADPGVAMALGVRPLRLAEEGLRRRRGGEGGFREVIRLLGGRGEAGGQGRQRVERVGTAARVESRLRSLVAH